MLCHSSQRGVSRLKRLLNKADHLRETFGIVLRSPRRRLGWIGLATLFSVIYSLLLPFSFSQRVAFSNWSYLDPYMVMWSLVLGTAMSLVLMIQITAMRSVLSAGTTSLTGLAFLASVIPSFLCCTPIVPTLLAFVGFSSLGLYETTGGIQYFFATQQTLFLSSSLAILLLSIWWSSLRLCNARCRYPQRVQFKDEEHKTSANSTEVQQ